MDTATLLILERLGVEMVSNFTPAPWCLVDYRSQYYGNDGQEHLQYRSLRPKGYWLMICITAIVPLFVGRHPL